MDSRDGLTLLSTGPRQTSHSDDELMPGTVAVRTMDRRVDESKKVVITPPHKPRNGVVCRVVLLDGTDCQVEIEVS